MNEYTKSKLEQIKAQYDALTRDYTFNQYPFNLLSDSDRVLFATELVESQAQHDRDQMMIRQNEKMLSEIDDMHYRVRRLD